MRIFFIPGSLSLSWVLPAYFSVEKAESIDSKEANCSDIVVVSAAHLEKIPSDGWPVGRWVVDAVDTDSGAEKVRDWLLNGAKTVVLYPSERSARFLGFPDSPDEAVAFHGIVGESEGIKELIQLIEKVSLTSATVLIRGESGTGKELVAQAIHRLSPRKSRPFIPVNCAAIPETLLEDDLFGHVKGAFTDARSDRKGKLEEANGGTLFLDEIGDMAPSLQVKLLRVLQEREIQPLGSNRPKKVDVRIIAATAADLEQMIQEKRFREDLYYRLNVIPLSIPPLRERTGDIPRLISHFSTVLGARHGVRELKFTDAAIKALSAHPWQGNVRELEHFVERMLVLFDGHHAVGVKDLPPTLLKRGAS